MRLIAVTTGDEDGIGWEVAAKALLRRGRSRGVCWVVFRGEAASDRWSSGLEKKFRRCVVRDVQDALELAPRFDLIEVVDVRSPVDWVEESARLCLRGDFTALTTGPLSKTLIRSSGRAELGHTGLLSRLSKRKDLRMAFLGREFNVVLATGHVPLKDVSRSLTFRALATSLDLAEDLRRRLPVSLKKKSVGLVGLNPHAGESGLIGSEERRLYSRVLHGRRGVVGPLVPDAAFQKQFWKRYSVFVCPYHDQGLIPFKLVHGQSSGAHVTLGLPFVRTSVDHGTAKDLFGQNRADCGSMVDALHWAELLTRRS